VIRLQRRFLHTSGLIVNHDTTIIVRQQRRTYSPYSAGPASPRWPSPWVGATVSCGSSSPELGSDSLRESRR
jgi:hypothetical protein